MEVKMMMEMVDVGVSLYELLMMAMSSLLISSLDPF
jgi:hypothetical protein